mmetsp:Transcript_8152/g.15371  ORF Transcript_8152/g.15371 Transcript_8152/m.15371 type:complete len:934 (-) Transcript_8152:1179-3980(-)
MGDIDLDNLSPEDKAMFDAMVAEEMRKLEEQFQKEANIEANATDISSEQLTSSYVPSQPLPARDYSSSHIDVDFSDRRERELPRQRRDDNSLNPGRLAYKSPEWSNEDEVLVGRGGRSMGIGRHETKEEKRRKQQEYAAQLNDGMVAQRAAISPRDRHAKAAAKRAEGLSVSRSAGSHRNSEQDARRQKVEAQQKYALELQEQQSARQRAEEMPQDRKRVQRRTQSPIQPSNILSSPTSTYTSAGGRNRGPPAVSDREKARQKQADYYRQLEADKQVKATDSARDRPPANRNVRAQSPIQSFSSPSSNYGGAARGGADPMSERERARQKQAEYYRQLEADKQVKGSQSSSDRQVVKSQPRMSSPINRGPHGGDSGQLSERDKKHQRQQEYAMQLKLDMRENDVMVDRRSNRSEPSLRSRKQETDLGIQFGGQPQLSRREKQAEYARQIKEAAEKEEIVTPRRALSARRQGNSPHQNKNDHNSGTGLAVGTDVATAAQRANKRARQSQYRDELAQGSNSKPISSSRVSLHSHRSRQDEELGVRGGGAAGFSTAGLIGNQESEHDKMMRKRESQKEYFNQLQAGPSPSKNKAISNDQEFYSKPVTRDGSSHHNYDPPSRGEYQYEESRPYVPSGEPSQRYEQVAYKDPYEPPYQQPYEQSSYQGERRDVNVPSTREPLARQDTYDVLQEMRAQSQSHIVDDSHYSPTKPVVSEDGNVSFDGINPPYGRFNKGMNVPDGEGKMPSARKPPPQQRPPPQYDQQQQYPLEQNRQLPNSDANQGTSLMIGKMDVQTSEGRDRRAYEQQKYVQDLENEKHRAPIQSERVSLIQQSKYQGNGLPGSNVPQQIPGGHRRGGAYQQPQQQQEQPYAGHRGTSTGGGASSVVLAGGYAAEESPRMHRKGAREEYAEQLYQQQQPQELYAQHQQYYQQGGYGGGY